MQVSRDDIVNLVAESLEKSDVMNIVKKDKDFERRIKEITTEVVTDLFRVLWQHNAIYKTLAK